MKPPVNNRSHLFFGLPEELVGFVVALALNVIFIALVALLLWPLGKGMLALRLAKGYGVLWVVAVISAVFVERVQRILRLDIYSHADAYVFSNLGHCIVVLAGWSAFSSGLVHTFVIDTPVWLTGVLWLVGALSSHLAFIVISSFYPGQVYTLINAGVAFVSFVLFAIWPASGRALYGWFLDLF